MTIEDLRDALDHAGIRERAYDLDGSNRRPMSRKSSFVRPPGDHAYELIESGADASLIAA